MAIEEEPLQRLNVASGQTDVLSTARARQMHVIRFGSAVVLDAIFEVRVDEDTELVEKAEGSVDGGSVDPRNPTRNHGSQAGGADVVPRPHHLRDDRPPLRSDPQPPLSQHLQYLGGLLSGLHPAQDSCCKSLLQHDFGSMNPTRQPGAHAQ